MEQKISVRDEHGYRNTFYNPGYAVLHIVDLYKLTHHRRHIAEIVFLQVIGYHRNTITVIYLLLRVWFAFQELVLHYIPPAFVGKLVVHYKFLLFT